MPFVTNTVETAELGQAELDRLLKDPKAAIEYRILRATRRLLADKGLQISVDEIAEAAEVGRRTVFRYFESRDALVARALEGSLDRFYAQVTENASTDMPLDQWLHNLVASLAQSQLRAGAALWQLAAANDSDLPDPIAKVNRKRRASRKKSTREIASQAWVRAGGGGELPPDIELAFAHAVSAFTVQSLNVDYGATFDDAVAVVTAQLVALLRTRVAR